MDRLMRDHVAPQVSTRLTLSLAQFNNVYENVIRPRGIEFVTRLKKYRSKCLHLDHQCDMALAERKRLREEQYRRRQLENLAEVEAVSRLISFPIGPAQFEGRWTAFHRENREVRKATFINAYLQRIRADVECPIQRTDRRLLLAGRSLTAKKARDNLLSILIEHYN